MQHSNDTFSPEGLVDTLYQVIMGRPADADGLSHHAEELRKGVSLETIVKRLLRSEEFKEKGGFQGLSERLELYKQESGSGHPLAEYAYIYTASNSPYFTFRGLFRPLMMVIETVNICNNDCVICAYSKQTRRRGIMSDATFELALRQYVEIGGGDLSLTPVVGEVFLDKRLHSRLRAIRRYPSITKISATTNATMVRRYADAELSDILSFFHRIKISVYGFDDDEYYAMTQSNDFDETIENIIRILRLAPAGAVVIGLRNLKRRSRAEGEAWISNLAARAGVVPPLIVSNADLYANWGVLDTSVSLPFDGSWKNPQTNTEQCLVPLIAIQVLVDGRISFCSCDNFDADSSLTLANIHDISIRNILADDHYLDLWRWEKKGVPRFCTQCSFHVPIYTAKSLSWMYKNPISFIGG
jgi:hypothetical protein